MGQGFKSFNDIRIIKKHGASAHPVWQIKRIGKNQTTSEWFVKELDSIQEAQVECMTGEIYRYLIGPTVAKIRLSEANTVASEGVNFYSVRDIFENKTKRYDYKNFKKAFCEHLDGFMMVVFSSIFLEENDLSANNYGLVVIGEQNFGKKKFGGFTKIDHGQSFNTLRIAEEKRLAGWSIKKKNMDKAPIKYFPPILPVPNYDWRSKENKGRKTISIVTGGSRKYEITYAFLDRIVLDFLDSRIDKDYIQSLKYQPSILPFYDNRLLTLLKDMEENVYDEMEVHKYFALGKIIFTSEAAYLHIAKCSTRVDQNVKVFWKRIKNKIKENRSVLSREMRLDPEWFMFCELFHTHIKNDIRNSWDRMLHKTKTNTNVTPGLSDRYGTNTSQAINPFDGAAMKDVKRIGKEYLKDDVLECAEEFIKDVKTVIINMDWKVGKGGGKWVEINDNRIKVPTAVKEMYEHILLNKKCQYRFLRCVKSITQTVYTATQRRSKSRHRTTTLAYSTILSMAKKFGKDIRKLNVSKEAVDLIHPELLT